MHTWKQNLLLRISPITCLQLKKHDAFQGSLGYQCEKRLNNGTSFQRILYVCAVNEDSYKEHSDLLVLVSSCYIFSTKLLINLCGSKFYSYLWILKKVRKASQTQSWKWYIYLMLHGDNNGSCGCFLLHGWLGQSKILIKNVTLIYKKFRMAFLNEYMCCWSTSCELTWSIIMIILVQKYSRNNEESYKFLDELK